MTLQTLHLVLKTCLNFGRSLAGKCRSCGSWRKSETRGPTMSAPLPPRRKRGGYRGGVETFRDLRRVPMGKASGQGMLSRRLDLSDVLIDS
jgi:hypothetical protein